MKQAHVFISGVVQGVGYRYFVKSRARKLGISGWVRNMNDGRVEAVFQFKVESEKLKVEEMIEKCRKGPFLAEVRDVGVVWEEGEVEYNDFQIVSNR